MTHLNTPGTDATRSLNKALTGPGKFGANERNAHDVAAVADWLLAHGWQFNGWIDTRYTAIMDKLTQHTPLVAADAALLIDVVDAARTLLKVDLDRIESGATARLGAHDKLERVLAELDAPLGQPSDD